MQYSQQFQDQSNKKTHTTDHTVDTQADKKSKKRKEKIKTTSYLIYLHNNKTFFRNYVLMHNLISHLYNGESLDLASDDLELSDEPTFLHTHVQRKNLLSTKLMSRGKTELPR